MSSTFAHPTYQRRIMKPIDHKVALLLAEGCSQSDIARILHRHRTTVWCIAHLPQVVRLVQDIIAEVRIERVSVSAAIFEQAELDQRKEALKSMRSPGQKDNDQRLGRDAPSKRQWWREPGMQIPTGEVSVLEPSPPVDKGVPLEPEPGGRGVMLSWQERLDRLKRGELP